MADHVLENSALRVTVSDAGAELVSVLDKASGSERIWTADPSVWNRHAPILFPFVGRVAESRYRIGTAEYPMKTQHGFARDLVFALESTGSASVTHLLESCPETKAIYPYDFRLSVTHALDEADPRLLHIRWQVENRSQEEMRFSIGGHPAFLLPAGADKQSCFLRFEADDNLRCFHVDGATGLAHPDCLRLLRPQAGLVPFQESIYDTWIFPAAQVRSVSIAGPDGQDYVTLSCPGFPFLAVWAKESGPFICLEPWFGRTDDRGFRGSLSEKPGEQCLAPGQSWEANYTIRFF